MERMLNLGIRPSFPLDLESPAILRFEEQVVRMRPELDQRDSSPSGTNEAGKISLFRRGIESKQLEVQIKADGVQGATSEGHRDDQIGFLKDIATATEELEIPKLRLEAVDVRYIFKVTHWGNHYDLIADVLGESGFIHRISEDIERPLHDLDLKFAIQPTETTDLVLIIKIAGRTVSREIRSGNYDGDDLVVVCGVARTGGFHKFESFVEMVEEIHDLWTNRLEPSIVNCMVEPLDNRAVPHKPHESD